MLAKMVVTLTLMLVGVPYQRMDRLEVVLMTFIQHTDKALAEHHQSNLDLHAPGVESAILAEISLNPAA